MLIIIYHLILTRAKINFLVLGKGPTYDINGSFGAAEKKFSINFTKGNTKFCLSLHYSHDNSYLFINGKEIYFQIFFFNLLHDSASKMMENAFYFVLKALFILKIFVLTFWSCRKNDLIFEIDDVTAWLT